MRHAIAAVGGDIELLQGQSEEDDDNVQLYCILCPTSIGGCMAASTLCILCVVSRHISCI